ncbi:MAG: AAA family ATPase [Candidatus Marinimicrobia bacterium]|nr:AAA family ATPase [Candidatus Neomarinimicrobiota bacterium]
MNSGFVWVEKYRPSQFEDIVLDPLNRQILSNIIETSYFPNLLFYGPPGTGKTTTIINLINAYQAKLNNRNKDMIIHLNASDERGIDIIRNQISSFVNSKPLFNTGMKFVILDEVDYMTKTAQQALRYLLQSYTNSVRFCLICNYISKIDEGLQNEFIRLRFNQLPKEETVQFLNNISTSENLNISHKSLQYIQQLFKSDIRSMINFLQSNQDVVKTRSDETNHLNIIDNDIWDKLISMLANKEKLAKTRTFIDVMSIEYNIDKKNMIKDLLNYIIRSHPKYISNEFLKFTENLMHSDIPNNNTYVSYSLTKLSTLLSA